MKVLHILNSLMPSGAEVMIYQAYDYWKDIEHCILATGNEMGIYAEQLEKRGYRVEHVTERNKLKLIINIYSFLKKESPGFDIVHIHRESMSLYFALAAKMAKTKLICRTVHSNFSFYGFLKVRRQLTRWIMRKFLAVKFVAIGDSVERTEETVLKNKCSYKIYNWYNSEVYRYVDKQQKNNCRKQLGWENNFYIVSVGNCSTVKNHKIIIEALKDLKYLDNIKYIHIGYERDTEERELIKKYHLEKQAEFIGYQNPEIYLKAGDLFIMSSIYEGFSIASLEAASIGMPVLLSDVEGLCDFKKYDLQNVYYFLNIDDLKEKIEMIYFKFYENKLENNKKQSETVKGLFAIEKGVNSYRRVYETNINH